MSYWPEPHEAMAGNEPGTAEQLERSTALCHRRMVQIDALSRGLEAADEKLDLIRHYCHIALDPLVVGNVSPERDAFARAVLAMIDGEEGT